MPTAPKTKGSSSTNKKATRPFPFLGSGDARYYKSASLLVWFEAPPSDETRQAAAADMPAAFRAFEPERVDNTLLFETDDTLDLMNAHADLHDEDAAWERFAEETAAALLRIHARTPITFAAKELADEGGHDFDAWHKDSLKRVDTIREVVLAAPSSSFMRGIDYLLPYLSKRAFHELRDAALEKLSSILKGDVLDARRATGFCADLLNTCTGKARQAFEGDLPAWVRVALAVRSEGSLEALCAGDGAKVIEAASREGMGDLAPSFRSDIATLCDRLGYAAIKGPREQRGRYSKVAAACLRVPDATTAAQRVIVFSVSGALDGALEHLADARRDEDRYAHAVATAIAEAVHASHRPLIDACVALASSGDAKLLEDPVMVANLLVELLGRSQHEQAAALAHGYIAAERSFTPALRTNVLLAFAQANDAGAGARKFAEELETLLRDDPNHFVTREADLRGSAHAWLALWWGLVPDFARAYGHLEVARDLRYPDFAVLPNHPLFVRLAGDVRIKELFAANVDAAVAEKDAQIAKNARDWWAIFSRGLLFHERGDLVRAMTDYEKTIALNPTYPDVYINIGNVHWARDKDFAAAIRFYDKALSLAPKQFFALQNRAEARIHVADYRGAIDDATRALAIQPSPHVTALRALAHARRGDLADAKRDARAAIAKDAKLSSIDDEKWRDELRVAAK